MAGFDLKLSVHISYHYGTIEISKHCALLHNVTLPTPLVYFDIGNVSAGSRLYISQGFFHVFGQSPYDSK